ncbi:MAG TPA: 6-pyruvoyl-tetrahydropterin synthase-related protein, partial [Edaphobacter sp.]|nr:6-pyruvoyl-tetrahydropterin synthase-related protein [Edaphobacter sp.]
MHQTRLPYFLIPLAAFLATIPLLIHGCSCGHDFDFHVLSWLEAARQFTHGNLHPHWAYTPAYNAGEPRFVFYPPLSWTIGAILGLLFPWTWTPILYTWLALTSAGLALHRLARDFTTGTAALIAAVLYTVNPYMLFTAYERSAYAELLAVAWIPLLLQAILRSNDKGGVTIPRIAIPIALLWLTNAPAAVMSCYALALLTIIRLAKNPGAPSFALFAKGGVSRASATAPAHLNLTTTPSQTRTQLARNTITGTVLGLGLAAFYILPAAYQRRYVQIAMAIIPNMRIQDNFLFHRTGDPPHDQVLHTASLIAVLLVALTVATLTILYTRRSSASHSTLIRQNTEERASSRLEKEGSPQTEKDASSRPNPERAQRVEGEVERPPHFFSSCTHSNNRLPLTILTITIALLLTPPATPIWTHAPELAFLQFPWRLVAILAAVLALAIALALKSIHLNTKITTILAVAIAAALTYPAYTAFHQTCDQEATVEA